MFKVFAGFEKVKHHSVALKVKRLLSRCKTETVFFVRF